jgi:hypothetical protein
VTFGCRSRLLLAREGAEYRVLLIFCCLHHFSKSFVKDVGLRPMRRADAIDHLASRLDDRVSAKTLASHASAQSTRKAGDSPTTVASWSDEEQKTQHKCRGSSRAVPAANSDSILLVGDAYATMKIAGFYYCRNAVRVRRGVAVHFHQVDGCVLQQHERRPVGQLCCRKTPSGKWRLRLR